MKVENPRVAVVDERFASGNRANADGRTVLGAVQNQSRPSWVEGRIVTEWLPVSGGTPSELWNISSRHWPYRCAHTVFTMNHSCGPTLYKIYCPRSISLVRRSTTGSPNCILKFWRPSLHDEECSLVRYNTALTIVEPQSFQLVEKGQEWQKWVCNQTG